MQASEWKELLNKQKSHIVGIQEALDDVNTIDYKHFSDSLKEAIAIYQTLNHEYEQALAKKLKSTFV